MIKKDYVIGIDCSTTASKAIVWDKEGNFIAEGREGIPLLVPKPEWAEQDADKWWDATVKSITPQSPTDHIINGFASGPVYAALPRPPSLFCSTLGPTAPRDPNPEKSAGHQGLPGGG